MLIMVMVVLCPMCLFDSQAAAAAGSVASLQSQTASMPPSSSSVNTRPPPQAARPRPQAPEADMELIRAMNELGPAIKTMRLVSTIHHQKEHKDFVDVAYCLPIFASHHFVSQEAPTKAQNKQVSARDEVPHTISEEILAQILEQKRYVCEHVYAPFLDPWKMLICSLSCEMCPTSRKDNSFSMEGAAKVNDLRVEDLENVVKYLGVPKIVERQGVKYGYWPHVLIPKWKSVQRSCTDMGGGKTSFLMYINQRNSKKSINHSQSFSLLVVFLFLSRLHCMVWSTWSYYWLVPLLLLFVIGQQRCSLRLLEQYKTLFQMIYLLQLLHKYTHPG